jgi:cytochrome P450
MFGNNLVSSEGMLWRRHRRVTAPLFTEKNNRLVWLESLHQAQNMVRSWTGADGKGNVVVTSVAEDTMRLSLHVISRAGFGVRLLWPGQKNDVGTAEDKVEGEISSAEIPEGHTMSFKDALSTLLESVLWLALPKWILSMDYDSSP